MILFHNRHILLLYSKIVMLVFFFNYRRSRKTYIPRKRPRRSENGFYYWLKRQKWRLSENGNYSESPGAGSVCSESDIGSGPIGDSPFGSQMSTLSIPSPKQLRWAYSIRGCNHNEDTTSIASSATSPLGKLNAIYIYGLTIQKIQIVFGRITLYVYMMISSFK